MDYKCPLDGFPLSFSYGEGNDAYRCPFCGEIYPTLSTQEADILKDINSQALNKLKKYQARLGEIKKEEKEIDKIFEFTKKSGLLSKLNKANLSAQNNQATNAKKANQSENRSYLIKLLDIASDISSKSPKTH